MLDICQIYFQILKSPNIFLVYTYLEENIRSKEFSIQKKGKNLQMIDSRPNFIPFFHYAIFHENNVLESLSQPNVTLFAVSKLFSFSLSLHISNTHFHIHTRQTLIHTHRETTFIPSIPSFIPPTRDNSMKTRLRIKQHL